MGQVLQRLYTIEQQQRELQQQQGLEPCSRADFGCLSLRDHNGSHRFPDLLELPPELGLTVLSYLNPTDLCLAACVWEQLANDELLWQGLCRNSWGSVSIYSRMASVPGMTYRKLFMILDEASLTFNSDPFMAVASLTENRIVDNEPMELARFIHTTKRLWACKKREFLEGRQDIFQQLVHLQNFQNQFLPNALRQFFREISAPETRGEYLATMMDGFSERFCSCNPKLGLSKDTVFVLCYSLIMLSVDLTSPHVKNKMSKREFIKNTCRAAQGVDGDFAGHLYDNIYLIGHVAADVTSTS
ncbi:F-box only protein 8-like [Babylonia areolata]|uniref:F-box only protein 8-like n=1 Tax=Babylonia areolata TaxID=304850 RepID=UPI003FD27CD6